MKPLINNRWAGVDWLTMRSLINNRWVAVDWIGGWQNWVIGFEIHFRAMHVLFYLLPFVVIVNWWPLPYDDHEDED